MKTFEIKETLTYSLSDPDDWTWLQKDTVKNMLKNLEPIMSDGRILRPKFNETGGLK